jgi:hypothetical protein
MLGGTRMLVAVVAAAALLAGCGSSGSAPTGTTARSGLGRSVPSHFASRIDNPWFPLLRGMTWIYRGVKDGEPSRDVVTVPGQTKMIDGVRCTAVRDRLYLRGRLEERTIDWYAQDASGNVWYFGEATAELKPDGTVKSTEGSWQAGVDGAQPGVFMTADPRTGQTFRQEFYKGQAEDHFQVLDLAATVKTPAVSSNEALLTKEWTPLEPGVLDHKLYVRGFGTVKEQTVKGGDERNILVEFRKS